MSNTERRLIGREELSAEKGMPPDSSAEPASEYDGLAALTTALTLYFTEVDDAYRVCVQHEGTTAVSETRGCLCLSRLFQQTPQVLASVRQVSDSLPGWRASLFWSADGGHWTEIERESLRDHPAQCGPAVTRGVSWNGRPVLVRVRPHGPDRLVALDLLLPPVSRDLPELPLRRVAAGLRCHAHFVPDRVAAAVSLSALPRPGERVREYLTRATPPGLYASQCFSTATEV